MCALAYGTGQGSGANPISKTPFMVFINDKCPECAKGDLDLSGGLDGRWKYKIIN
jgi:hypothetical protein